MAGGYASRIRCWERTRSGKTDLPPGKRAIGLKWVYKVKKDNMGNLVKKHFLLPKVTYKNTGLILLRFSHQWLDLAAQNGWVVHHLDVKSAFLRGDLKEEVYVTQPDGYVY